MKIITRLLKGVGWLALCQLPMLVSMPFVDPNMTWYHTLTKPPLVPPDMIFGMVWTVLYLMLGVATALIFYRGVEEKHHMALWLLGIQLALNACWTPVFFGLHNLSLALAVVVLMLAEGYFMHRAYAKHSQLAALMLWPYWLWLGFATYLTAGFMMLN
ncbi:MAG: tryptophan-rich sensory protein [Elusimicrobiaceae bacterium]|nr:tryptophan-rich sensory protein [Elusimicrobiaceae bacterium]